MSPHGRAGLSYETERVVATVQRLFRARRVLLWERDRATESLRCVAAASEGDPHTWLGSVIPIGEAVAGRAFAEGRAQWIPDVLADASMTLPVEVRRRIEVDGARSVAATPLIVEAETLGALSVSDVVGRTFTDDDLAMLAAFAGEAALALHHGRLHEFEERRAARLRTLARLNQGVSSLLDMQAVLGEIARAAAELMNAPVVSFWIADEATRTIEVRAWSDETIGSGFPERVMGFDQGMLGWVAAHRRSLNIPDVFADPRSVAREWRRAHGLRSFLGVPVMLGDSLLAVLALSGRAPFELSPDDEDLVANFIAQAAVAIQNARLYAEATRRWREAEEALATARASEASFRLLFRNNPLPMWVYDVETLRFLEVNTAAVGHYGYARNEFLGMRIGDISPPEDVERFTDAVAKLDARGRGGGRRCGHWRHRRKDGRVIDVEILSHALEFGGRRAALVAVENVTERRALEEQLRQSQKIEAIGQLAGGIAHDFNNLLTVITARAEMLRARLRPDDAGGRDATLILKTAERASALTQRLLAFSRWQILQPKVLDLNALVEGMVAMLRRMIGEDIDLRIAPSPNLGRLEADPGQVEQVILNLAVNARDAMPHGGRLSLETADMKLDEPFVRAHPGARSGTFVMLRVSDTGSGMDAATLARVFEPFFTTKEPGRGTGLATVYGIVKQHDGYITADSEPGRGSVFTVYLPRVEAAVEVADSAGAPAEPRRGSETVLLVEDQADVRDLARELLEREGYTVLVADGPKTALAVADEHPGVIDALVTDVVMPEMGGRELAGRLAATRPALKVLYMSGYTNDTIARQVLLDARTNFLQKPFASDALPRKLREVLDRSDPVGTRV
jgi:PAS domain S-box-containing protein